MELIQSSYVVLLIKQHTCKVSTLYQQKTVALFRLFTSNSTPPFTDHMNFNTATHFVPSEGHFPLGGIFSAERHFLLSKDQLAGNGRQKTKENIIPRGKFRLVLNGLEKGASQIN